MYWPSRSPGRVGLGDLDGDLTNHLPVGSNEFQHALRLKGNCAHGDGLWLILTSNQIEQAEYQGVQAGTVYHKGKGLLVANEVKGVYAAVGDDV